MKIQRGLVLGAWLGFLAAGCGGVSETTIDGSHLEKVEGTATEGANTVEGGGSGEIILPSGPAAAPEASPAPEAPVPTDPVAAPFSLHLDAEEKFETRVGLVRLSWIATGPIEELYLWSDGFNREKGDATAEDPCGPIADAATGAVRHPLLNAVDGPNLGAELNDGSPAHAAMSPYLESARLCDASMCEGFAPSAGAPACRIDLDPSRAPSLYTRALVPNAVYRLCAKTAEGVACEASEPVVASQPFFSDVSAAFSPEGAVRVTAHYANAVRAAQAPAGCTEVSGIYDDRDRGRGTLVADCAIDATVSRGSATGGFQTTSGRLSFGGFAFVASGVGNSVSETIRIDAGEPKVTLQAPYGFRGREGGCTLENRCEGTVTIRAKASRDVVVTRNGDLTPLLSGKSSAGIGWIHLQHNDDMILPDGHDGSGLPKTKTYDRYKHAGTEAVTSADGEVTFTNVVRNHERFRWRARVSVGGETVDSQPVAVPYVPTFEVTPTDTVLAMAGNRYEGTLDGHVMTVKAHHIKHVRGTCTSSYGYADYSILAPGWGYDVQTDGTLHPMGHWNADVTDASNPLTCRFWGVAHDGKVVDAGTFTWTVPNP